MLDAILAVIFIYISIVLGMVLPTLVLIFTGNSWDRLSSCYLRVVGWIQSLYPAVYPESKEHFPGIINKHPSQCLTRNTQNSSASFPFLMEKKELFQIALDLTQSGIESIVQDELAPAFSHAQSTKETLLRWMPLPQWSLVQRLVFLVTLSFRIFFLLPVRFLLFTSSFLFLSAACAVSFVKKLTEEERTWCQIVFCRIFNTGLGVVSNYSNPQFRPQKPGIAVSNHLTANDVQVLIAGTPHGSEYSFMVTGQKHTGVIGCIASLADRLINTLWLERSNSNERTAFLRDVLTRAKEDGPILLFPEGYCTNNSRVLQFRKAAFDDGIKIYPISMKQRPQYGDAFWFEDKFHMHLLRMMYSWAAVYDIQYLEPTEKTSMETNSQFAHRVQEMIAKASDIPATQFDGGFWYKKSEQFRILEEQRQLCSTALIFDEIDLTTTSSDCEFELIEPQIRRSEAILCN